jgi:hypothetical protein
LLVIDPPERANGLELLGDAVPLLLDPALADDETSRAVSPTMRPQRRPWVRSITLRALFAFAGQPEFGEMRRSKLVLVFPERLLRPDDTSRAKRVSLRLGEPDAQNPKIFWRAEGRSPSLLDFDPMAIRCVRVLALSSASTAEAPELDWRASAEGLEYGSSSGVWLRQQGADGPVAMFDLSRSFAWMCGKRIRRLSFQQAPTQLVYTEGLEDAPRFADAVTPIARGDDWVVSVRADSGPKPAAGEGRWVLGLFDLARFGFVELTAPVTHAPELVFPGAAAWERDVLRAHGGPIAWTLGFRIGETDVLRQRGRKP